MNLLCLVFEYNLTVLGRYAFVVTTSVHGLSSAHASLDQPSLDVLDQLWYRLAVYGVVQAHLFLNTDTLLGKDTRFRSLDDV